MVLQCCYTSHTQKHTMCVAKGWVRQMGQGVLLWINGWEVVHGEWQGLWEKREAFLPAAGFPGHCWWPRDRAWKFQMRTCSLVPSLMLANACSSSWQMHVPQVFITHECQIIILDVYSACVKQTSPRYVNSFNSPALAADWEEEHSELTKSFSSLYYILKT